MKRFSHIIVLIFLFVSVVSCNKDNTPREIVNTSHLDYLYEEININKTEMAIIHIYSNYPSYEYVDDEDEDRCEETNSVNDRQGEVKLSCSNR